VTGNAQDLAVGQPITTAARNGGDVMSFPSANAPVFSAIAADKSFAASFTLAFGSPECSNNSFI